MGGFLVNTVRGNHSSFFITGGVKVAFTRFALPGFLGGNGGLGGGGGASFTITGGVNTTWSLATGGGGGGTGFSVLVFCAESWMEIKHTTNASIVFFIYRFLLRCKPGDNP